MFITDPHKNSSFNLSNQPRHKELERKQQVQEVVPESDRKLAFESTQFISNLLHKQRQLFEKLLEQTIVVVRKDPKILEQDPEMLEELEIDVNNLSALPLRVTFKVKDFISYMQEKLKENGIISTEEEIYVYGGSVLKLFLDLPAYDVDLRFFSEICRSAPRLMRDHCVDFLSTLIALPEISLPLELRKQKLLSILNRTRKGNLLKFEQLNYLISVLYLEIHPGTSKSHHLIKVGNYLSLSCFPKEKSVKHNVRCNLFSFDGGHVGAAKPYRLFFSNVNRWCTHEEFLAISRDIAERILRVNDVSNCFRLLPRIPQRLGQGFCIEQRSLLPSAFPKFSKISVDSLIRIQDNEINSHHSDDPRIRVAARLNWLFLFVHAIRRGSYLGQDQLHAYVVGLAEKWLKELSPESRKGGFADFLKFLIVHAHEILELTDLLEGTLFLGAKSNPDIVQLYADSRGPGGEDSVLERWPHHVKILATNQRDSIYLAFHKSPAHLAASFIRSLVSLSTKHPSFPLIKVMEGIYDYCLLQYAKLGDRSQTRENITSLAHHVVDMLDSRFCPSQENYLEIFFRYLEQEERHLKDVVGRSDKVESVSSSLHKISSTLFRYCRKKYKREQLALGIVDRERRVMILTAPPHLFARLLGLIHQGFAIEEEHKNKQAIADKLLATSRHRLTLICHHFLHLRGWQEAHPLASISFRLNALFLLAFAVKTPSISQESWKKSCREVVNDWIELRQEVDRKEDQLLPLLHFLHESPRELLNVLHLIWGTLLLASGKNKQLVAAHSSNRWPQHFTLQTPESSFYFSLDENLANVALHFLKAYALLEQRYPQMAWKGVIQALVKELGLEPLNLDNIFSELVYALESTAQLIPFLNSIEQETTFHSNWTTLSQLQQVYYKDLVPHFLIRIRETDFQKLAPIEQSTINLYTSFLHVLNAFSDSMQKEVLVAYDRLSRAHLVGPLQEIFLDITTRLLIAIPSCPVDYYHIAVVSTLQIARSLPSHPSESTLKLLSQTLYRLNLHGTDSAGVEKCEQDIGHLMELIQSCETSDKIWCQVILLAHRLYPEHAEVLTKKREDSLSISSKITLIEKTGISIALPPPPKPEVINLSTQFESLQKEILNSPESPILREEWVSLLSRQEKGWLTLTEEEQDKICRNFLNFIAQFVQKDSKQGIALIVRILTGIDYPKMISLPVRSRLWVNFFQACRQFQCPIAPSLKEQSLKELQNIKRQHLERGRSAFQEVRDWVIEDLLSQPENQKASFKDLQMRQEYHVSLLKSQICYSLGANSATYQIWNRFFSNLFKMGTPPLQVEEQQLFEQLLKEFNRQKDQAELDLIEFEQLFNSAFIKQRVLKPEAELKEKQELALLAIAYLKNISKKNTPVKSEWVERLSNFLPALSVDNRSLAMCALLTVLVKAKKIEDLESLKLIKQQLASIPLSVEKLYSVLLACRYLFFLLVQIKAEPLRKELFLLVQELVASIPQKINNLAYINQNMALSSLSFNYGEIYRIGMDANLSDAMLTRHNPPIDTFQNLLVSGVNHNMNLCFATNLLQKENDWRGLAEFMNQIVIKGDRFLEEHFYLIHEKLLNIPLEAYTPQLIGVFCLLLDSIREKQTMSCIKPEGMQAYFTKLLQFVIRLKKVPNLNNLAHTLFRMLSRQQQLLLYTKDKAILHELSLLQAAFASARKAITSL